jgi:hypothetical protein
MFLTSSLLCKLYKLNKTINIDIGNNNGDLNKSATFLIVALYENISDSHIVELSLINVLLNPLENSCEHDQTQNVNRPDRTDRLQFLFHGFHVIHPEREDEEP